MGLEMQIDSLEDMCELMCNNRIPRGREPMNKDKNEAKDTRDCNNCKHYKVVEHKGHIFKSCSKWDCEYEKKEKPND